MKPLSRGEIAAYIRTGEPLDKAGGYAAQGIGSYMVQRIEGSYANVVGLPIAEVVERLERDFAYPLWEEA
jgi:septum formation protein